MTYTFARIGAASNTEVRDVYPQDRRLWVRLHQKGGKQVELPCHHSLESYLDDYMEAAGLKDTPRAPLFQTFRRMDGPAVKSTRSCHGTTPPERLRLVACIQRPFRSP
ncbi:hypothetical protein EHI48_19130 [Rhizobium sp. WSM1325]|nr:hypothetical protein EHI48_19130 [Rhizobium leguminosarum]